MNHVKPSNDRNAIKVAAFVLEFVEEVEESLIDDLMAIYQDDEDLRKALPRKELHQSVIIQLANPQQASSKKAGGVTFDYLAPDGTQEWAVSLSSNALVVSCGRYTRWEEIWPQVKEYFNLILPLLSKKTFSLIALEYLDEFIIEDNASSDWKAELFKLDSEYIPPNIYKLDTLWHSHHGFIVNETNTEFKDINPITLNNVNIEYIVESGVNKIFVRTQHKSQLIQPFVNTEDFLETVVDAIINKNHIVNKAIIRNLLSDEMCSEINLGNT